MPTRIQPYYRYAVERGHCEIEFVLVDTDNQNVEPKTCFYTLTDDSGNIINGIDRVAIDPTMTSRLSNKVILRGDDLQVLPGEVDAKFVWRHFTVEATADSALGSDLPINDVLIFPLYNALAIS